MAGQKFDTIFPQSGVARGDTVQPVFDKYYTALCFFADKLISDKDGAEDIVENLFIKLWERQPDFSKHANIKAVLYIGVKNACLDFIKTRRNNRIKQDGFAYLFKRESEDFILNEITRAEVLREIYAEMQKLPPECRKVMQLYYQQGLDHKTISEKLGIAVSTVRNHKSYGLRILKRKLGSSFLFFLVMYG